MVFLCLLNGFLPGRWVGFFCDEVPEGGSRAEDGQEDQRWSAVDAISVILGAHDIWRLDGARDPRCRGWPAGGGGSRGGGCGSNWQRDHWHGLRATVLRVLLKCG